MRHRLALLGPVSLTGPAKPGLRRATQQRRLALLAIIASSPGGSVSRDRLLGLLWPERDERIARHLLADSIYVLRQALGDGAIIASAETVRLAADRLWTDTAEFHDALADSRWEDALKLWRGDFLEGFHLRNAAEFDQWITTERNRLRALATRAAFAAASALEASGRATAAVAAAERAFELAPCDEAAFRQLIRLLIASDNRARAEAVARGFVEQVALEFGVPPSAETMRLVREAHALGATEPIVVVAPPEPRPHQTRTRMTDSVTASLIAQGRHHWHQRTRHAVERAMGYFTRATERQAHAVEGWCGLADAWTAMGGRGYLPVELAIAQGSASAERALALDDSLSAVHTAIGGLDIIRRRWADADAALRRAIELDPHNANARHWHALALLTGFGAADEAMREQTIAAQLNPVSPIKVGTLGWHRYLRGDYDLSRSSMEPAVDLNAELEEGHAGLARVAARLGDETTVMTTIAAGITRRSDLRGDLLAEQASAMAILGDTRRARKIASEASRHDALAVNLALAWASVGDADRAFEYLSREPYLVYWAPQAVWWDPRFDAIRDDRRFAGVLRRVEQVWSPEWSYAA